MDVALLRCANLYNAALQEWRDAYSYHVGYDLAKDAATNKPLLSRDGTRYLYNERREKREEPSNVTLYSQYRELTAIRKDDEYWGSQDVSIGRGVLQRLERAKNAFYRRVKVGEKPGYPRFKAGRRWHTIDMANVRPNMVKGGKVKIKGLPPIAIRGAELPPSTNLKALRITRAGRRVTVSLTYAVEREPLPHNPACVGIDMGISDRMVLSSGQQMMAGGDESASEPYPAADLESAEIPTSGSPILPIADLGVAPDVVESPATARSAPAGSSVAPDVVESPYLCALAGVLRPVAPDVVESPSLAQHSADVPAVAPDGGNPQESPNKVNRRRGNRADITRKQQRLSRCKKGSHRWKQRVAILANAQARAKVSNRNECHRITTDIIQRFGHIGIEALQIRNMTRNAHGTIEEPGINVAAKSGLNREILTQTWGLIHQQLTYKAEWAGRRLVEVDPRHTSQTCAVCGVVDRNSRDRKLFHCTACGHRDDADHNAAVNILRKSLAGGNSPPLSREAA